MEFELKKVNINELNAKIEDMEKLLAKKEDHVEILKVLIKIIKFNNLERNQRSKS